MTSSDIAVKNYKLNSLWALWYHNPNDSNWDLSSYHKVIELRTINDFWDMFTLLKTSHFQNGMFFIMRNEIKPMWEDLHNVDGGCWSFRVNKKEVPKTWLELVMLSVGETLMKESKYSKTINGISISPKRSFSIIKIWNNNVKINEAELLNPVDGLNMNEIIYKPHVESIDKDKEKRLNKHKNELRQTQQSKSNEEEDEEEDDDNVANILYQQHQARLKEMLEE